MNRNAGQNPTDAGDAGKGWTTLLMSVLATVLILAKDIGFSLWARRKLYSEFRERAGASRGADPEDGAAAVTASGLAARHRSDLRLVSPGSSLEWAARPIREDAISEGLQTWFGSL